MFKNKYFAILISIVALVFVYFSFFRGHLSVKHQKAQSYKSPLRIEEKIENKGGEGLDPNKPFQIPAFFYSSSDEWGRDPFRKIKPLEETEESGAEELPELTAIIIAGNRVSAVLNGKVIKEGERIDGILVKKILPNCIIIDRGLGDEFDYIFNVQKGGKIERNL
ncbi:MAG: hypothetical protein ACUVUG_00760 [Candidatus Aminicenantia bacterium]